MTVSRLITRLTRPSASSYTPISALSRSFGSSALRFNDASDRAAAELQAHRENQTKKQPNQFVPNTTSTMTKDFPNVGNKPSPPEMLNSVDPNYRPADPYPGKIEHFTGGRQDTGAQKPELGVGEMEGITFKVEPLKRVNEDVTTMRARLLCTSPESMNMIHRTRANKDQQTRAASAASSNPTSSSQPSQTSTCATCPPLNSKSTIASSTKMTGTSTTGQLRIRPPKTLPLRRRTL